MIEVYVCHDKDSVKLREDILMFCEQNKIPFCSYDEDIYVTKKKSYKTKGTFAARKTPFCGVYKNKKPFKGFYTEAGECNSETIEKWLLEQIKR